MNERIKKAIDNLIMAVVSEPCAAPIELLHECFCFLINDASHIVKRRGNTITPEAAKSYHLKLDQLQHRVGTWLDAYDEAQREGVSLGSLNLPPVNEKATKAENEPS